MTSWAHHFDDVDDGGDSELVEEDGQVLLHLDAVVLHLCRASSRQRNGTQRTSHIRDKHSPSSQAHTHTHTHAHTHTHTRMHAHTHT